MYLTDIINFDNTLIWMMLGSKGTNPIVLAQIGFGTCDPSIILCFYYPGVR